MWKIILVATFVLWGAMDAEAVFDYDDFGYDPDFDFGRGFVNPNEFHNVDPNDFYNRLMTQIWPQRRTQQRFIQHPQAPFFDNIGLSNNRYAPNYAAAAASGSIGPNGGYQSVFISPENPDIPNIRKHFVSSSPDGFKGVFVSSFSSSSNINGKQSKHQHAQTTINDNGRITTYKVQS